MEAGVCEPKRASGAAASGERSQKQGLKASKNAFVPVATGVPCGRSAAERRCFEAAAAMLTVTVLKAKGKSLSISRTTRPKQIVRPSVTHHDRLTTHHACLAGSLAAPSLRCGGLLSQAQFLFCCCSPPEDVRSV